MSAARRAAPCRGRHARGVVLVMGPLMVMGLVACGDDAPTPTSTTLDVGIANPASVYCVEQGGTVEIVTEEDGQVGYCNLPDGRRVEEWEFFVSETGSTVP